MKRRVCRLMSLLLALFLLGTIMPSAFADVGAGSAAEVLSAEEAQKLIDDAFYISYYSNYRQMVFLDGMWKLEAASDLAEKFCLNSSAPGEEYLAGNEMVRALERVATATYTNELAEKAWKQCCYDERLKSYVTLNAEDAKTTDISRGGIYSEKLKKSLICFPADVADACLSALLPGYNSVHGLLDDWLSVKNSSDGQATAEVTVCFFEEFIDMAKVIPCKVNVSFVNTRDGWRICGGEYVDAMCNAGKTQYELLSPFPDFIRMAQRVAQYQMGLAGYTCTNILGYTLRHISFDRVCLDMTIEYLDSADIVDAKQDMYGMSGIKVTDFSAEFEIVPFREDDIVPFRWPNYFTSGSQYGMHLIGGTLFDFLYSNFSPEILKATPYTSNILPLSDAEAWGKVKEAYYLLTDARNRYSLEDIRLGYDRFPENRKVFKKYNTVGKMSEYAESLFIPSISNLSWRYDIQFGSLVWHYRFDADTPIYPVSYMHMGSCSVFLWKNFEERKDPTAQEACFTRLSEKNGIIEYSLRVYFGDNEVGDYRPVFVNVRFMNTENGWRIADCGFFELLSIGGGEELFPGLHWECSKDVLWYRKAEWLGWEAIENGVFSDGTADNYRLVAYNADAFVHQISAGTEKAKYVFRMEKKNETGEWVNLGLFDAMFQRGEVSNSFYSEGIKYENYSWNIIGGSFYDLTHGAANVAPYTGDDTPRTVLFCTAAMLLSAFGAHIVWKTKKTNNTD